jgi:hypothetical protein
MWCVLECDKAKNQKPSTTAVNKWVAEGRTTKKAGIIVGVDYSTSLSQTIHVHCFDDNKFKGL